MKSYESELVVAAEEYIFEKNGDKFSNNNNEAGDNFASFLAGANWAINYNQNKIQELSQNCFCMDWLCPKKYPPKNGDIVFGLTVDDYDSEWEPLIQRYIVVYEPEPNTHKMFSYFLIDENNNIIDDEETDSILTQQYSVILYKVIKSEKE
jgi:hypothetical protein